MPLLERLGLHRPELRAWAMYDWANSAMVTTIVAAVFPIYWVQGFFMRDGGDFLRLAVMVGVVQGGTQALSRSLFASMIPRQKSGQFFGFWSVFEKFAGILGPAAFTAATMLTGSSRSAILALIAFFVIGGFLLSFVNVEEGRQRAREVEREIEAETAAQQRV